MPGNRRRTNLPRVILGKYIGEHPLLELAAVCADALEAQQVLAKQTVQVIFLDINLPRISGTSFFKKPFSSALYCIYNSLP